MDPNRFAGPVEAALLREHIDVEEAELHRIQARLKTVATAVHDAEQRLRAAQEEAACTRDIMSQVQAREALLLHNLHSARGLLHPIRRLPDDVLTEIFSTWLDDVSTMPDNAPQPLPLAAIKLPFTAASVCKRWRAVALRIPALWTTLEVLFKGSARYDAWSNYLDCILQRSGSAPLSVLVTIDGPEEIVVLRLAGRLLRMHKHIRSLDITTDHATPDVTKLLLGVDMPALETLTIQGTYAEEPLSLTDIAPKLHTIFLLNGARISWSQGRRLKGVRELHIESGQPLEAQDLAAAAARLPNLTTLDISTVLLTSNLPAVAFPHLSSLTIQADFEDSSAPVFHCPRLESYDTSCLSMAADFQGLATLTPSLPSCNTLKRLTVRMSGIGSLFIDSIKPFSNLEELVLSHCDVRPSFFRDMSRADTSGKWITPRLWRLHIDLAYRASFNLKCDAAALQRLVQIREAASTDAGPLSPAALRDVLRKGYDEEV